MDHIDDKILTILKQTEQNTFLGKTKNITTVQGIPEPETILEKEDILVIYGTNKDLNKFVKHKSQLE